MNFRRLLAAVCRWTGRSIGIFFVVTMVIIAIGEGGMPNPLTLPVWGQLIFLGLALVVIGILLAWRWEMTGGIVSLVGYLLGIVPLHLSPRGLTLFYLLLIVPALLLLTSALLRRTGSKDEGSEQIAPGNADKPRA